MTTFRLFDDKGRLLDTVNYDYIIQFELIDGTFYCTLKPPVKFTVKGKPFRKNKVSTVQVSGIPEQIPIEGDLRIRSGDILVFDYMKLKLRRCE